MELKDRLRALREEKKLSAAQLAGAFEKSEGAVRMWETGRSKPDADTLIALSKYFECTTDYLLGLSNNKNEQVRKQTDEFIQKIKNLINAVEAGSSPIGKHTLELMLQNECFKHIVLLISDIVNPAENTVSIQSDDGSWESVFTFPGKDTYGDPNMNKRVIAKQYAHDFLDELIMSLGEALADDYYEPKNIDNNVKT